MKRAHDAEDESEDDSGENLMEDLADDYVAIPELDVYDREFCENIRSGVL